MNNTDISELISDLRKELGAEFALNYQPPIAPGSGHALELESRSCLGTISIWSAGSLDWHIFDIATSTEAFLGHAATHDIDDLRKIIFDIFQQIRQRDESVDGL